MFGKNGFWRSLLNNPTSSRASYLTCFVPCVLLYLTYLVPYVFSCLRCLVLFVLSCLTYFVLYVLFVLSQTTCFVLYKPLIAVLFVLLRLTCFVSYILCASYQYNFFNSCLSMLQVIFCIYFQLVSFSG